MLMILAALLAGLSQPATRTELKVDYPAEALRHRWEGDTAVSLTIAASGRPTACRVIRSSGHPVLDEATCHLYLKRSRFPPATDDQKRPVESTVDAPEIRWRLPK